MASPTILPVRLAFPDTVKSPVIATKLELTTITFDTPLTLSVILELAFTNTFELPLTIVGTVIALL